MVPCMSCHILSCIPFLFCWTFSREIEDFSFFNQFSHAVFHSSDVSEELTYNFGQVSIMCLWLWPCKLFKALLHFFLLSVELFLFYFTFSNIFITDLYLNFLLIFKLSFWYIFEHMSYAIDFVFWKILYWIFLNFSNMDLFLLRIIASLSSKGLISPLFWEFYYLVWVEFPFQNLIFYFLFCLLILEEHFPQQLPETQCVG